MILKERIHIRIASLCDDSHRRHIDNRWRNRFGNGPEGILQTPQSLYRWILGVTGTALEHGQQ
jgi:hypothetical protein